MIRWTSVLTVSLFCCQQACAQRPSLLDQIDFILLQPTELPAVGAVTLSGIWRDSCIPQFHSFSITEGRIDLLLEHPGINVGCADVLTPWSIQATFGPLSSGVYSVVASLYAFDPAAPDVRQLELGPELLDDEYTVVPEPTGWVLFVVGAIGLSCRRSSVARNMQPRAIPSS